MLVLFDQGTPVPLRAFLRDHQVEAAYDRGWNTLQLAVYAGRAATSDPYSCSEAAGRSTHMV